MDAEQLRSEIPLLDSCVYLNTGASGPGHRRVIDAVTAVHRTHKGLNGPHREMYGKAAEVLEESRDTVAQFVGASPNEIAWTQSTVDGINHIATSLEWSPGDVIVRTDLEHPAGRLPWERLANRYDVTIREVPSTDGRLDMDALDTALEGARLVCLSSISWNYGTRLPIQEVCDRAHAAGAMVLVDAVQSLGQAAVDVKEWGADFVAASGHKWMLGVWGSGILYIDQDVLSELQPSRIGYFSVEQASDDAYTFVPEAKCFELGTMPIAPYVGLKTSVEVLDEYRMRCIENRIVHIAEYLVDGLEQRVLSPANPESGLVTFGVDEPEEITERLMEEGIEIRWLPEPRACRASIHAFNTVEDVDRLLAALS